jgi:hypothetical protein
MAGSRADSWAPRISDTRYKRLPMSQVVQTDLDRRGVDVPSRPRGRVRLAGPGSTTTGRTALLVVSGARRRLGAGEDHQQAFGRLGDGVECRNDLTMVLDVARPDLRPVGQQLPQAYLSEVEITECLSLGARVIGHGCKAYQCQPGR